ncbi:hypothetical protein BU17DRAFT_86008 [Hysterangium stoloniferum]|nr:hypothetical protein BU17DRAFT_86008 [Hysterangium stoloniferum]
MTDTPTKGAPTRQPQYMKKMNYDVRRAIEDDLHNYYHVEDKDKFLSHLVPISDNLLSKILHILVGNKTYQDGRWKGFPRQSGGKENRMYAPFINVANAIDSAVDELGGMVQVQGQWRDVHSRAPDSKDPTSAALWPDAVRVSMDTSTKDLERRLDGLDHKSLNKTEKVQLAKVWWLQVFTVVEMKTTSTEEDIEEALKQLCSYMRQLFHEQLDRWFAFGIALCFDQLFLYLCDRSGVLGMATPVDIHHEPKTLIRVIASFALLDAQKQGWDTNMQVYHPTSPTLCVPSYQYPYGSEKIGEDLYKVQWVIKTAAPRSYTAVAGSSAAATGNNTKCERFLTIYAISIIASEMMCGQASVVWEAVKLDDRQNPKKTIYILKQGWERFEGPSLSLKGKRPFEGETHELSGLADRRIYSSDKRPASHFEDEDRRETNLHQRLVTYEDVRIHNTQHGDQLVSRAFTRTVLETWGWPLVFFKDNLEMLQVIRDAVKDHKQFYMKGVLHHDVSPGNILICPIKGHESDIDMMEIRGCLINLDQGKHTEQTQHTINTPGQIHTAEDITIDNLQMMLKKKNIVINDSDIRLVLEIFQPSIDLPLQYVMDCVEGFSGLPSSSTGYSNSQLGWNMQAEDRPNFEARVHRKGLRTATLPYMSHEALQADFNESYVFIARLRKKPWTQEAAHDMESFLWVILYLAITCGGPGGFRRKELKELDNHIGEAIRRNVLIRLFDCEDIATLGKEKSHLFSAITGEEFLEKELLVYFHPYFHPLKPLVRDWQKLLMRAFRFRAFEYDFIHDKVLVLLDNTIESLMGDQQELMDEDQEKYNQDREGEVARRQKLVESLQSSFVSDAFKPADLDVQSPNQTNRGLRPTSPDMVHVQQCQVPDSASQHPQYPTAQKTKRQKI